MHEGILKFVKWTGILKRGKELQNGEHGMHGDGKSLKQKIQWKIKKYNLKI